MGSLRGDFENRRTSLGVVVFQGPLASESPTCWDFDLAFVEGNPHRQDGHQNTKEDYAE